MARAMVDAEYLSDVWTRINSVFSEQKVSKKGIAKQCGFDRKILSANTNICITYFARLCEELNVSADFLDLMKQEIIDVIKKYIEVDEKEIDVRLTNQANDDGTNGAPALYANIPIVNIKNELKAEKILEQEEMENQEEKETEQENSEESKDVAEDESEESEENEKIEDNGESEDDEQEEEQDDDEEDDDK